MIASLLTDREVPSGSKLALAAMAVYLASPVDLIPDFLPIVGYLDDLLVAAIVIDGLLNYLDALLVSNARRRSEFRFKGASSRSACWAGPGASGRAGPTGAATARA